jgi:hypothetical protein
MRNIVILLKIGAAATLVLVSLLTPAKAQAFTACNHYSDGCTICDFYGKDYTDYQGSIEWCTGGPV